MAAADPNPQAFIAEAIGPLRGRSCRGSSLRVETLLRALARCAMIGPAARTYSLGAVEGRLDAKSQGHQDQSQDQGRLDA